MVILALGKARSCKQANCGLYGGWQTWVILCFAKKNLHESCRMGRRIVVMNLICSLDHCEWDGHTVHKLSQQHVTADWLPPREIDCSQMHSKVSSDCLSSYIKAIRPLLEIFKKAGYFLDSPHITIKTNWLHSCYKFNFTCVRPWRSMIRKLVVEYKYCGVVLCPSMYGITVNDQCVLYRVIHESLRNFRTRLRNNQDRHSRKEHISR